MREIILDRDGHKCRVCDKATDIVHHLDGDRSNNDPRNLLSLCKEHHDQMPRATYFSTRMFLTKEKTTTKEGYRNYMKLYMRSRRARFERKHRGRVR